MISLQLAILLTIWAIVPVCQGTSWTTITFQGLDDLYTQTLQTDKAKSTGYGFGLVGDVCEQIVGSPSFKALLNNQVDKIHTKYITQMDIESGEQVEEFKYFDLVMNEMDIDLYLHPCTEANNKKYFLTRAYEKKKLFFLFIYDYTTRELALSASVEKSAIASSSVDLPKLEVEYIENRMYFFRRFLEKGETYDESDDAVCSLSPGQKLRLCALVLNTDYYQSKYTFIPNSSNVQSECTEPFLLFSHPYLKNPTTEYMYHCVVHDINEDNSMPLYISRSYRNKRVFVYVNTGTVDSAVFDNKVGGISFVVETAFNGPDEGPVSFTNDVTMTGQHAGYQNGNEMDDAAAFVAAEYAADGMDGGFGDGGAGE